MKLQHKSVAIIGGGPGGLTLARLLQQQHIDVTVYERDFDKNARVQGAPLDLHEESGLAALRKAGLLEAFKQNYMPGADRKIITDDQGMIFFSDHEDKAEEDFGNPHFRPEIDRGALRKLLLESLALGTVIWNSHFLSMEAEQEGWKLYFKDGAITYADVVIAADGSNSRIRPYITSIKAFYSGITMLEGNVYQAEQECPQVNALLNGGKIMAFGRNKNLLLGQKSNGEIGFYASFKTGEDWSATNGLDYSDPHQMLNWFRENYREWNHIWDELFKNAAAPMIPRPIYCMPLDQVWEAKPNLSMLGDAAHVMPPFAGEGVNMAMLDALELSDVLTSGGYNTLQIAIGAYEANMRNRAALAAKESLENGERMHSETALTDMLEMFQRITEL